MDSRNKFSGKSRKPAYSNNRENNQEVETTFTFKPKTALGRDILAGKYASFGDVLLSGRKILENEIVDYYFPGIKTELINIGQQKGKFGGGKRKNSKNTQKKSREGSKMSFTVMAVVGNGNGYVGVGVGSSRETVPAREKAIKNAKKNVIMVLRGCGDWGCFCGTSHSIPFAVEGKEGSVSVRLSPAPKGTGLVAEGEIKKLLEIAGIKDVWCRSFGQTKNKINFVLAAFHALQKLERVKLIPSSTVGRGIKEGDKNE